MVGILELEHDVLALVFVFDGIDDGFWIGDFGEVIVWDLMEINVGRGVILAFAFQAINFIFLNVVFFEELSLDVLHFVHDLIVGDGLRFE